MEGAAVAGAPEERPAPAVAEAGAAAQRSGSVLHHHEALDFTPPAQRRLTAEALGVAQSAVIDVDPFEPFAADAAVWPVRPAPNTGELPSSWLSRVALANGLTPRSFFRGLVSRHEIAPSGAYPTVGGLRPCDPWVDHRAHPRLTADIALRSARNPVEIAAMSLTRAAADAGSAPALLATAAPEVLRPAPSAADGPSRRSVRLPGVTT